MFCSLNKNRIPINPKLREYCIKSTNESIRKLTEKYNEERKNEKFKLDSLSIVTNDDLPQPNNNDFIITLVCVLSSSTILYYFYKCFK